MFQKINKDIAQQLGVGTLVVKYPLEGNPQPLIDLSKINMFLLYEIKDISRDSIMLMSCNNIRKTDDILSENSVQKTIEDLVTENRWWFRNEL